MWEIISWEFWQQNMLLIMFVSAFLSATVLPGNSEFVFVTFAAPKLLLGMLSNWDILWLLSIATAGNSLGSLTTYWVGRLFPENVLKNDRTLWVMSKLQRYGLWGLLLSWLPIVGDVFCVVAGWLRLNWLHCLLFISLGKLLRYGFLLFLVLPLSV
ncbi:YqaA family protein [Rodentibacter caecimuris]|uniref:VTT domain-containing protein n=1 Tax=Rodentibacter caecimuris TaxID=1796644 RepID=A0ABX3L1D5_9PAST|nr:hypothetical protein BKG89_05090 [Rodentibacter heylii]